MTKISYAITLKYPGSFKRAVLDITRALKDEGFGILTQIDVKETLRKKLKVTYPRYIILGACSPSNAYKALQAEEEIGLLLPCNVIIYEKGSSVYISTIKPSSVLTISQGREIAEIAQAVEIGLIKALKNAVGLGGGKV